MSQLIGWLNTSPTKTSVWLKPKSGVLNESIFVNLESNDALKELVELLREAYTKRVSFEMEVELTSIKRGKSGKAFIVSTLGEVLDSMRKSEKTVVVVDEAAAKKAAAIRAELAAMPTPAPATATVEVIEVDFE